jgi:hypothetical protein
MGFGFVIRFVAHLGVAVANNYSAVGNLKTAHVLCSQFPVSSYACCLVVASENVDSLYSSVPSGFCVGQPVTLSQL